MAYLDLDGRAMVYQKHLWADEETVGDPTEYAGHSSVVRPDGNTQAGLDRSERDLVADFDPSVLAECREFIPTHEERVEIYTYYKDIYKSL